jgi:hypothetical protein
MIVNCQRLSPLASAKTYGTLWIDARRGFAQVSEGAPCEAREENEKEETQENTGGSAASSTANGCLPAHPPGNADTADVAASTVPMTENPAVSGRAGVVVHVTGNQFGCKTASGLARRCWSACR